MTYPPPRDTPYSLVTISRDGTRIERQPTRFAPEWVEYDGVRFVFSRLEGDTLEFVEVTA